ncbi:50S ribosomal protein L11 [Candidatus Woesearchaeota archaeon CG10_big_fil_rev_8_21_14_0_10_32_24]|nr:MAG: 50S ribosomal protein L11 [Candidatus Woesearchaeota archaeon CG10_big_fil_rev_8_21_14_0_10_32_24]
MAKQTIETLIQAGKATAAPPLGPALGPTGVNIGQVVAEINKKTADLAGMQVPVKVTIDTETKAFTIEIGTPPATALIMREAGIKKGAGNPLADKVADLKIQQVMKIAKTKEDALLGKNLKMKVLEIAGTCQSMGVMIEGMPAFETIPKIKAGMFDDIIASGRTELSEEERKSLEEERKKLQKDMEKRRTEFEAKAKGILKAFEGKPAKVIRKAMEEAEIPMLIINELAPAEEKKK